MQSDFFEELRDEQQKIEDYLSTLYPEDGYAGLNRAMRYSLLAGGKRIRPVLTRAFCRITGGDLNAALQAGAAIEMVHTYSLIHDDLPCMDNDSLRRGKPTSHIVFGEAGAVLAGDALLTEAFFVLSQIQLPSNQVLRMVATLASCAGANGMVGGQSLDLQAEHEQIGSDGVRTLQLLKTGALLRAACQLGVLCSGQDESALRAAAEYADHLGYAFQIRDDLLDKEGSVQKLGKQTEMDGKKTTFLSLYGAEWCRNEIMQQTDAAKQAIAAYPNAQFLSKLADELAVRDH